MVASNIQIKVGDTVELKEGLQGTVLSVSGEQVWNGADLENQLAIEIESVFGIDTISNHDVAFVI
jgi:hypothetical protein